MNRILSGTLARASIASFPKRTRGSRRTAAAVIALSAVALFVSSAQAAPPPNDAFSNAFVVTGESGSLTATNAEASIEAGEPEHGRQSVWYRWTAPASGMVVFETCNAPDREPTTFDSVLAVYVGSSLVSLERIGLDDDACGLQSRIAFSASAGTVYHVVVASVGGSGSFTLRWGRLTPPPNDNFDSAQPLSGEAGTASGTTFSATVESGEPAHGQDSGTSVWYAWTAPSSGELVFETCGSSFDTVLAVYTGDALGQLTQLTANDDACGSGSRLRLSAQVGTTYRIAVAGVASSGEFVLTWLARAANDDIAQARRISGTRGALSTSNAGASADASEPPQLWGASVWFRWRAPRAIALAFATCTSSFDTLVVVYRRSRAGALVPVAANDDGCRQGLGSVVVVRATRGVNYYVAVDGFRGRTGTFRLTWGTPAPFVSCIVPDVRGDTLRVAHRAITQANCGVGRVVRTPSAIAPRGVVITQFPKPGKRLRFGSPVHLEVSSGRRR